MPNPRLKTLAVLLFVCTVSGAAAQTGPYWSAPDMLRAVERAALSDDKADHLAIRPLRLKDFPTVMPGTDTLAPVLRGFGTGLWQTPSVHKWAVGAIPLLDVYGGYEAPPVNHGLYRAGAGVAARLRYGPKWSLYADVRAGSTRPPSYVAAFVQRRDVVPGLGENRAASGNPAYLQPTASLSFAPSEHFTLEAGYGKNAFGYGRRSLLLGDIASNYPYLKIITDAWRFRYVNLYAAQTHLDYDHDGAPTKRRKYSATHYLSWAVSPRWNLGVFESIVWQGRDTLSDRGFDPNYLNPIIFLRPVEYSVGSPDNALMGFEVAFKASKKTTVYGQLLIDEFLLSEFRAGDGWWANKWGAQLGAKTYGWPLPGLSLRAEFNTARPFTYTHGSAAQNYAHLGEPLAHRLGTNFYEASIYGHFDRGRWYAEAQWTVSRYGRDPDSLNLGGDIFRSYVNPARIYGNYTGQGIASTLLFQKLEGGYVLNRDIGLKLSFAYGLRHLATENAPGATSHFFMVGVATDIYARDGVF